MKILITGGSGFLGHNLILALSRAGHAVSCLDRYESAFIKENRIDFILGDISEKHLMDQSLEGVDAVIHLACTVLPQMSNSDPLFDVETNIGGTLHLLDAAVKNKVGKFIFLSSGGTVYGIPRQVPIPESHPTNPTCSYGISKLMVEKYMRLYHQLHGLNTCALRLANPYGPHQRVKSAQGVIPVFCYRALTGQEIEIWGDGSVRRDFIYVGDFCAAMLKVIEKDVLPFEINIGSGRAASLLEILDLIERITGKKPRCRFMEKRAFDVPISLLDISEAQKVLGWRPEVSLPEGLERTVRYIKENCLQ